MRNRLWTAWLAAALCAALAGPGPAAEKCVCQWPTFHCNNWRTGLARVDFPSAKMNLVWTFSLGEHTWAYEKGMSVWSASPVVADAGGKTTIFVGAYDHNLYALEAATGRVRWRYTTGGALNAAPAFAEVGGRPMVFIGSADRRFYAVDAATGQKIWSYETMPWTYTVGPGAPSSPLVAEVGGEQVVYVAFWNNDHRPAQTIQRGEIFAFDAATGKLRWRHFLTTNPISGPVLVKSGGRPLLIVGSRDGTIYAIDARTGAEAWHFVAGHSVMASPAVTKVNGKPALIFGDFFGMIYCLEACHGTCLWRHKVGHLINGTAAIASMRGQPIACVPSYDRCLHAVAATTGREVWRFATRKYIAASPAIATIQHLPVVFCSSLGNRLFAVDLRSGTKRWEFEYGDMLWPYETRGECVWSSPVVAEVEGRAMLFFAAHDGKLYAFAAGGGKRKSPAPAAHAPRCLPKVWLALIPSLGVMLVLGALALIIAGDRARPGADVNR